jgi:mRNA-degrading endonuclease RelE of RelBE toxin-antitoxin system
MVEPEPTIVFDIAFEKALKKLKNPLKEQAKKKIKKIMDRPTIGKAMKYSRKGTREVYVGSHRMSYMYLKKENTIYFLDFYHKNEQ